MVVKAGGREDIKACPVVVSGFTKTNIDGGMMKLPVVQG